MFIFIIWLICFFVTLYILGKRDQLNGLTIFLALFCWPLALLVALMVPADAMKPKDEPLAPIDPTALNEKWREMTPEEFDEACKKEALRNEPRRSRSPANNQKPSQPDPPSPSELSRIQKARELLKQEPYKDFFRSSVAEPPATDKKENKDKKDEKDEKDEGLIWYAIKNLFS